MPTAPRSRCRTPRCSGLAHYRGLCQTCARASEATRAATQQGFYQSTRWRRRRAQVLREEPFCRCGCGRPSVDVDHVNARRTELAAGRDPERRENLRAFAHGCHSRRTATDQSGWGRR